MDSSKYEVRVKTLYGVVLEAMEDGKSYAEVTAIAKKWAKEKGVHYLNTRIEERNNQLYIVVRTCSTFEDLGKPERTNINDVLIPKAFLDQAQVLFRDQAW